MEVMCENKKEAMEAVERSVKNLTQCELEIAYALGLMDSSVDSQILNALQLKIQNLLEELDEFNVGLHS